MEKLYRTTALVILLSFLSACGIKTPERSRVVEEAAVYSTLINGQIEVPFSYLMGEPILILNSTVYEAVDDDYLLDGAPVLDKDTVEDYKAVNKESQVLELALELNKPYEYITLPGDENGWQEFEQTYPNAISITSLSRIGFNKKLNQALVFLSYFCGNECGAGDIYFLIRNGDTWKVENIISVWVS